MVTVRKSKLLTTSSVIAENTYYYEFDVDTVDELPDPYYNGTIVAHGSKATVINSGEVYRINGDGEWKSQSTSGGTSLPDVTAEDNGDVLTVVDGAWDKATPTNSGVPYFTATISVDMSSITLDNGVTKQDVYNVVESKKPVIIYAERADGISARTFMFTMTTNAGYLFSDVTRNRLTNSSQTIWLMFIVDNDSSSSTALLTEKTVNDPAT